MQPCYTCTRQPFEPSWAARVAGACCWMSCCTQVGGWEPLQACGGFWGGGLRRVVRGEADVRWHGVQTRAAAGMDVMQV